LRLQGEYLVNMFQRKTTVFLFSGALLLGLTACNGKDEVDPDIMLEVYDSTPPSSIGIEIKDDHFVNLQNESLNEPFWGVTSSEGKIAGLYKVESSGVSTEAIIIAAQQFLDALSEEQKSKTVYAFNSDEWRRWVNVDNGLIVRNGTPLKDMTAEQKQLAFQLMSESLSAKGLQLSKDIMKTDQTLKEINNGAVEYDEELYFFTIMGQPSSDEPWGWQIDGHHLAINYFVLGDQIVMTPTFMGGEPTITTTGKYVGNTVFQDEQNYGLNLMQSLPSELQEKATISSEKTGENIEAGAGQDNLVIDYQGLKYSEMPDAQQQELIQLVNLYVSNMKEDHAQVRMSEIEKHLDDMYFAWRGKTDDEAVFYYRIHSPVVMIEFDHQPYIGVPSETNDVTRGHVHTMIRTPNGNDYGKDYLRQHLEKAHRH